MLNEIEEFKAYTGRPKYKSSGRSDLSYLGRFTFEMLKTFEKKTIADEEAAKDAEAAGEMAVQA